MAIEHDRCFTVRLAKSADAAAIADCLAELGYGTSAEYVEGRLSADAASPADVVLVACDASNGDVLGAASVHVIPLLHVSGGLARLTSLAVRRTARRMGIGRALVSKAESFALRAGCARIELTSGDQRDDAHAFYRALGYVEQSRRFVKTLDPPDEEAGP